MYPAFRLYKTKINMVQREMLLIPLKSVLQELGGVDESMCST